MPIGLAARSGRSRRVHGCLVLFAGVEAGGRTASCGAHVRCNRRGVASLHRLPAFSKEGFVHVVVESPRGASAKLKYEPELGAITFGRPLPHGLAFPFDFGFVPSTRAEDGDPLDAMILCDAGTYPGIVVVCRPIAVVEAAQAAVRDERRASAKRVRNDRVICVARDDRRSEQITDVKELPARMRDEIAAFFLSAVAFEGKDVEVLGWGDARAARRAIDRALTKARRPG